MPKSCSACTRSRLGIKVNQLAFPFGFRARPAIVEELAPHWEDLEHPCSGWNKKLRQDHHQGMQKVPIRGSSYKEFQELARDPYRKERRVHKDDVLWTDLTFQGSQSITGPPWTDMELLTSTKVEGDVSFVFLDSVQNCL